MKKIWQFLKQHIREDFYLPHYTIVAIFLLICITLNYIFDFEDQYLDYLTGFTKFFSYLTFYGSAYFFTTFSYIFFNNHKQFLFNKDFWIRSLLGLTVLSIDSSVPFLNSLIDFFFVSQVQFWAYKVAVNSLSFFTVMLPLLVFYFFYDRKHKHVYGLNAHNFDTSPYLTMLVIMLPIITAVSFNGSFTRQYPMYQSSLAHTYLGTPEWVMVVIYELAYGLDCITVEFLFRGFMVIGMMHILGRGAVLPMAVVYCFLHFGKPAGEAISSVFGGYILGVIAYETRSVWGGIIVHMGIAWMMELIAFIQKLFSD